ncbi:TRAP transporter substrate-binding protein [Chloroflexota bacterium]
MWSDLAHYKRSMDAGVHELFWEDWEKKHYIKDLRYIVASGNALMSSNKKLIKSPADMAGQKIRAPGAFLPTFIKKCGAAGVSTSGAEAYLAMQRGVVDGGCSQLSSYISRKWYEVQKYYTTGPWMFACQHTIINRDVWNSFTPEIQKILWDADREAYEDSFEYIEKLDEENLKFIEEQAVAQGGAMYRPTAEEVAAFMPFAEDCIKDWLAKEPNPNGQKVLDIIADTM